MILFEISANHRCESWLRSQTHQVVITLWVYTTKRNMVTSLRWY